MNEKDLMNALNEIDDDLLILEEKRENPLREAGKCLLPPFLLWFSP